MTRHKAVSQDTSWRNEICCLDLQRFENSLYGKSTEEPTPTHPIFSNGGIMQFTSSSNTCKEPNL